MVTIKGKEWVVPDYDVFDGLNFRELLEKTARDYPDKEALVYRDERVTYKEFDERVDQLAVELQKLGVEKGDRCAVLLPNSIEFIYIQYAILKSGGIFIALSTRYRKFEITYMLKHSGAKMLALVDEFMGTDFLKLLDEIKGELPNLKILLVKGKRVPSGAYDVDGLLAKHTKPVRPEADQVDENEVASILYTSGSTGTPKGVMSTHRNLVWDAIRVIERLLIAERDSFLMMLPLSHIFASSVMLTHAIMGGCKVVIMDVFEPEEALRLIEKEGISILYGVPTMFVLMLSHPNYKKYNLSTLRTGYMSGAACPIELVKATIEDMGCNISAAYGMTECCCISITEYGDDAYLKSETVGRPIRDEEMKIVDDERKEVPIGQVGEIAVRGENVFKGYYKQPELTQEAFDSEGWFYTGDLAVKDENGRYRIVGRKKEMIIKGGFNIYPAEVEEMIYQIPSVQFAAVVGLPDKLFGEVACACVVPKPGEKVESEEIVKHLKTNLANYKVPDRIEILPELPMTTTNKIQKYKLKDDLIAKYGLKG
jgi:acyl-CoA synthetase (AMP-forming)/AMP-acid ligase II